MKRAILSFVLLLTACTIVHAALPEILPYGTDELPIPPGQPQNLNDPKVVDILGGQLNNPDAMERARLLAEIGGCKLPNGAKYAQKMMSDPEPLVRAQAAKAAGSVGDKTLLDDLKKLAGDSDARVRAAAVQAAGALGGEAIVATGLSDADASVVVAAVGSALPGNADAIAKALPGYPSATQLAAIRTLGRLGSDKYAGVVAPLLTSPSVAVRAAAVEAIGQMKATASAAAVEPLLADKHATVRRNALTATANLVPAADLQKRAIAALADVDLSVRENAANLLAKAPTPDAVDALAGNLASESDRLHLAARTALIAIGQPAVPKTEQLLTDADPRRREDASYILGQLKSDAGIDKHVALLSDKDWQVVRQAAESLGKIGRKEAVPELVRLSNMASTPLDGYPADQVPFVIAAIERSIVACTAFDEHSIIPVCQKVLPDKAHVASGIRAAAAYALGRMDDPKGKVPGIYNRILGDMEDGGDVKLESLKGFGHMKSTAGKKWYGTSRDDAAANGERSMDWIAYWCRWKVTGKDVPYDPLPEPWQAPVSVHLIPG